MMTMEPVTDRYMHRLNWFCVKRCSSNWAQLISTLRQTEFLVVSTQCWYSLFPFSAILNGHGWRGSLRWHWLQWHRHGPQGTNLAYRSSSRRCAQPLSGWEATTHPSRLLEQTSSRPRRRSCPIVRTIVAHPTRRACSSSGGTLGSAPGACWGPRCCPMSRTRSVGSSVLLYQWEPWWPPPYCSAAGARFMPTNRTWTSTRDPSGGWPKPLRQLPPSSWAAAAPN